MAKKAKLAAGECDTATAAKLIKCSTQWFGKLVKEGWIKKLGPNRYKIIDVVHGHIDFLKDENRRNSKTATASRVQEARAAEIEFRTAKERRDVIPVDDVVAVLSDVVGIFRSRLTGLPATCTRDPELRAVIEKELDALIKECRDGLNAASEAVQARRPTILEPEEADA